VANETNTQGIAVSPRSVLRSFPIYYGWINVLVAAAAMTATLPGRTHGLGLVTEPLLQDLQIDRALFAQLNFVASILGAAFCIPIGFMIDRLGVRAVATVNLLLLGSAVLGMSVVSGAVSLAVGLLLVRGLGQAALSVVSMALIGKWFSRRLGMAMGVFAVLLTFGFIGSVLGMGEAVKTYGWRDAWAGLGYLILALAPVSLLLARSTPEACGLKPDGASDQTHGESAAALSLRDALRTPAFWAVALGTSAFNLVWSAVTLFNESIFAERGFGQDQAVQMMAILTGVGLVSNLASGKLATRRHVVRLMGIGLALLATALAVFPHLTGLTAIRVYALTMGLTGGIITVVFFSAWGHLFGRRELGRIQGTAQLISVLASAIGPVIMAEIKERTGSYSPGFTGLAIMIAALAVTAFIVRLPQPVSSAEAAIDSAPGGSEHTIALALPASASSSE
jgi:MFS family permease